MKITKLSKTLLLKTTSFQVKVLQKKFTLLHAHFSKIVLKYSNEVHLLRYYEVHLLRYLTPLVVAFFTTAPAWLGLINL
jgi:hypothetical protein